MTMTQVLIIAVVVGGLVILNGLLYRANQKTPLPEGCEPIREACAKCTVDNCAMKNIEKKITEVKGS